MHAAGVQTLLRGEAIAPRDAKACTRAYSAGTSLLHPREGRASMEWLVIAGLGVWVWLQSRRIDTLTRRLATLEHAAAPATAPEAADKSQLEPLLLTTPAPPEDEEPLLLDTPIIQIYHKGKDTFFKLIANITSIMMSFEVMPFPIFIKPE
jgi:hypothetical protein